MGDPAVERFLRALRLETRDAAGAQLNSTKSAAFHSLVAKLR
jgi:hypothetical protein